MEGLKELVALCLGLLAIVRLPTTVTGQGTTNPIDFNEPPLWKTPCGQSSEVIEQAPDDTAIVELLTKINIVVQIAIDELNWKNAWAEETFQKSFDTLSNDMKKTMHPSAYLPSFYEVEDLEKDVTLEKMYELQQRVGVGMEQLVYDQFANNEKHKENFMNAYLSLRAVLCEVLEVMNNLGETPSKNIDRTDMPESERQVSDTTARNVRDLGIFVIYSYLLEKTKAAVGHLISQH